MLYKKNSVPSVTDELFKNPTSEYRAAPFWAWNTDLDIEELERQIDIFKEMGLGGFHMHVRTGLSTKYLSDEFMSYIKGCVDKAKKENMLAWLYDEDRWPSGAAGGYVTQNKQFRAKSLMLTINPCTEEENTDKSVSTRFEGGRQGEGQLIACYDIVLDENGDLKNYRKIDTDAIPDGTKWYAYEKTHSNSSWYNNQSYLDTLNKNAVSEFVNTTHKRYKDVIGNEFGETVPAIFTDEPQFARKHAFEKSDSEDDIFMSWTSDLPDTFRDKYGIELLDVLPELFWERADGKASSVRYKFHNHVAERFAEAFADTVGTWCADNNIQLTGHMMAEQTLSSQSQIVGDCMRSYRSFGIPGIDMLCSRFEFTTAKQCQSVVHQYGKEGMVSELYGVTGWDYDFRGYKLHGDWQAALGVTVRVPHLSWVAMGGEAKRDYPASISYQSPWYKEFSSIEDHFARVNTFLTRGTPIVKIGVIHPIESFWLHYGPDDKTKSARDNMDRKFEKLAEWLIKGSFDFDYINESLLPSLCHEAGAPLKVGKMSYDVIIVPDCDTLRKTTFEAIKKFKEAGGRLIFLGKAPSFIDAEYSRDAKMMYINSEAYQFDQKAIYEALKNERIVKLALENGKLTNEFIYQLRQDGENKTLFISRACEPEDKHNSHKSDLKISVSGEYTPVEYNTMTGEKAEIAFEYENGNTIIHKVMYDYDSLLLSLVPGKSECTYSFENEDCEPCPIEGDFSYTLSEKNVLLLDMAEYKVDDEEYFNEKEEILRLDNICREKCGLKPRGGHVAQPWVVHEEKPEHSITIRFKFQSEIVVDNAFLAIENPEDCIIRFNDNELEKVISGYYVDKDIKTIPVGKINKGTNTLVITLPLGDRTNTEWCYILGDFGVKIEEGIASITELPDTLKLGSITEQGFPFYGGNVTYHTTIESKDFTISIPHYEGTLTKVYVDNEYAGRIIYPPYSLKCSDMGEGIHNIDITLFGNRVNSFGTIHRPGEERGQGPSAWRTKDENWTYDYNLRKIGIESLLIG